MTYCVYPIKYISYIYMYGLTGEKANSNMLTIHDIISGKKSDDGLGVTSVFTNKCLRTSNQYLNK